MWWQEDRDPGVRETSVPPPSTVTPAASGVGPKRGNQCWGRLQMRTNTTTDVEFRHRGCPQVRNTLRLRMSVSRRHRLFTYLLAFNRLPPPMQMDRLLASVGSTALCGSALMRPSRLTVKMMGTGATHGATISHALQAGAPLSFLTCIMPVSRLPSFWISRPASLLAPLLSLTSAADVRQTNSRTSLGTPDAHEVLIQACWLRTSMARGMGFAHKRGLASSPKVYVITQHHCVSCTLRYSTWAFEGMVVSGKFRRAPDQPCSYLTVANVHIDNECAKRRSVCIALLLFLRDLCMKLGAVTITGDFKMAVERETPSGDGERRTSPLEAAFSHANIPWPTFGVTRLWGPVGKPNGGKWSDCCGFLVLPGSQTQWLIVRHGSIKVVPAAIGQRATDQNWHSRTVAPSQVCGAQA